MPVSSLTYKMRQDWEERTRHNKHYFYCYCNHTVAMGVCVGYYVRGVPEQLLWVALGVLAVCHAI